MLQLILMLNTMEIPIKKILKLKLMIVSENKKTKTFLLKHTIKIGLKNFLLLVKLKIQFRKHMLSVI